MSSAVSALNGAIYEGYVSVQALGVQGMITLRGDLTSADLKAAATDVAGVDMPGLRGITLGEQSGLAWMSPDELMVFVPYDGVEQHLTALQDALSGAHALAVNVSDARSMFELRGALAREVIAKLCPVDMSPGVFEPGEIRRTRMAQIAAAFWMVDDQTIRIVCFRSVAQYAFDLLKNAASAGAEAGLFEKQ